MCHHCSLSGGCGVHGGCLFSSSACWIYACRAWPVPLSRRRPFSVSSEYEYCRIDGNTPHDTRQDLIEEYNAPVCPCILHFNTCLPRGSRCIRNLVQDETLRIG